MWSFLNSFLLLLFLNCTSLWQTLTDLCLLWNCEDELIKCDHFKILTLKERSEIRLTISPVVFPFGFCSLWFVHFNPFCWFWFACVCHCWPSVQPLQLLTWDTCYFHYLVPTPMSPSSQSVSPPSETGSQESIDGGAVERYVNKNFETILKYFLKYDPGPQNIFYWDLYIYESWMNKLSFDVRFVMVGSFLAYLKIWRRKNGNNEKIALKVVPMKCLGMHIKNSFDISTVRHLQINFKEEWSLIKILIIFGMTYTIYIWLLPKYTRAT